jgi:predicted RND superfamily exporter protein
MVAIDGLARHLESLASVGKSISVADPLRQLNGALLSDESQPLPELREQISQLLLLLESDEYIGELISSDRMFANVLLRVNDNGSKDLLEVAREARAWWGDHGVDGFAATPTGIMYEFARAQEAIANGQLIALGIALAAVALVLLLVFRRIALAITALIPNVVPVSVLFGLMGWLGIPLDASTVVIGGLVLGIAVDDTVHVVSGYRDRLEAGVGPVDAVRETLGRVAHPLICSSAAVAAGFLILTTSGFLPVVGLGGLTSSVMLLCLAADLTLLPALLIVASRRGIPV